MRRLCATVLIFEVVVIWLAIPVAITIAHAKPAQAGVVGGVLGVAALVIAGLVGRPGQGWTLVGGTVLQAAVIATGVVVPAMYGLGVIFGALWLTAIWLGRRYPASPDPTTPPTASPDPATPPTASPDPATPPTASPDPATPPKVP